MEEVSALRVTLGLNTAEFSQRMKDVNAKLRAIKSEFSAADTGTKAWRNSLEGLQSRADMLNRQLEIQRQKVSSLRQQYDAVAAAQGADSRAAQNLLTQYNNAVGVMRRMETSLQNTNRRINEQTSEFGQLRQRVNTDVESMNRELRVLESSFEEAGNAANGMGQNAEQLRTRQQQLNQSIDIQRRRLQELNTLLEATTREEGANSRAAQEMQIRYNEANQSLNRTQAELRQTETQLRTQSSAWLRLGQSMSQAESPLRTLGTHLQSAGMNIAMTFGIATAVIGGALKNAITTGAEFESEMAKVGSKAGASAEELKKLGDTAQKLAPLAGGASKAATAMDDLAAKGYSTNQIISAMPGILNAANAAGEDLALTSDTITSALEAFRMQVSDTSHVADVLTKTANLTAAGMTDLQYTFKYAAAPAAQLGVSMEQLAAMTGIMANAGIKGETSGTALRAAMLRLVKPPKQAAEQLQDLGVKTTDANKKFRNFSDIIGDLNTKTAKMSNAEKAAAMARIFGTEAVSGMLTVISAGKPKIDEFTDALKNSDGEAEKAAKKMQDNFAGSMKKLNGAIDAAKIGIEQSLAPALKVIADKVQTIVTAFNNLSPGMKQFMAVGAAVSAIVLAIVTALGLVIMAVGGVIAAWATISVAMEGIGAVMMSSILPIVGIIAGIAAAGALLYAAWKTNFGGIRDFTSQVWTLIVQKFNEVKAYVMPLITQLVAYISERWRSIQPMVSQVMNFIGQIIQFILPFVFDTIKFYLNAIINVLQGAFNIIAGVIKFFIALFSGDWGAMWEAIKQILLGAVQAIWGLFNLWFVGKIAGVIGGFVNKGIGFIAKFAGDGLSWIGSFVGQGFSKISSFGSNIVSAIGRAMTDFADVIARWLAKAIKSFADFVVNIVTTIGGVVGQMSSIGVNIVKGIWSGISSMGSWLIKKIEKWALTVLPGPIAKALGIKSPSRLMRDKIGKWIPAGIAMGIENNMTPLNKAVNMMSLASVPTSIPGTMIQSNKINPSSNQSSTINQLQQALGPIIIQSVLNGRVIAEETYQDMSILINKANKGGARGRGVIMT